jgi:hypothetical protein
MHKIDTEGLDFELVFADVEQLNQAALKSQYDITKLSYHAYAYVSENYILLRSGSALGNNCGPLLISRKELSRQEINEGKTAIRENIRLPIFYFPCVILTQDIRHRSCFQKLKTVCSTVLLMQV